MEPTWWNGIGFAKDTIHILCKTEKDIDAYCAAIGLPREQLDDPNAKVDLPTTDRLYRRARELTGTDRVGLSLGPASNITMVGLVGHLFLSSPNLKTVLEGLGHYYALFANTIVYRTFEKGPHVLHEMEPVPFWQEHYPFSCRQVIEHAFSTLLHVCSGLVKRRVVPLDIAFTFPRPDDLTPYETSLGAPVRFGQPANRITFHGADVLLPLAGYNPVLFAHFRQIVEEALRSEQAVHSARSVRQAVLRLFNERRPVTVEAVAEALHTSVRSLQRKLQGENTSFLKVVEETKKQICLQLIGTGGYNVTEIAYVMGYNEPSAFRKAFKKWTGVAPTNYSKQETASRRG
ncbi:MAG TPA: AraC family transcriptional regulator [Cytophagales bacterium]